MSSSGYPGSPPRRSILQAANSADMPRRTAPAGVQTPLLRLPADLAGISRVRGPTRHRARRSPSANVSAVASPVEVHPGGPEGSGRLRAGGQRGERLDMGAGSVAAVVLAAE